MKGDLSLWEFAKALNGLIFYEHSKHKESLAHLKKIKLNVENLINERDRKKKD